MAVMLNMITSWGNGESAVSVNCAETGRRRRNPIPASNPKEENEVRAATEAYQIYEEVDAMGNELRLDLRAKSPNLCVLLLPLD